MRDIVWTIIAIWIVWKVYETLKSLSKTKTQPINSTYHQRKEGEIRIDKNTQHKSRFNQNDGEYVDYEEIK